MSGQTKPTAASYRFVLEKGADHDWAKEALATMRAPGYVMPPFDRPELRTTSGMTPTIPYTAQRLDQPVTPSRAVI